MVSQCLKDYRLASSLEFIADTPRAYAGILLPKDHPQARCAAQGQSVKEERRAVICTLSDD